MFITVYGVGATIGRPIAITFRNAPSVAYNSSQGEPMGRGMTVVCT